jgi:lipopolysaccharide export system protein LptA
MAASRKDEFPRRAAALLAGLLGATSGTADAQIGRPGCANPEIAIEAKPFEVDYRNNNAVLREVVITQCDLRIQADEARVTGGLDFENSKWTISGDVRINAEGGSLRSDKAVVNFRNNLISQATITGSPAEFEQQRDDGTISRGHANTIDYETTSGTVSLRDNAWLSHGRNEMTGPQLVYNIKTQSVQGRGKVDAGKPGDGRIRIVIQPRDGTAPGNDSRNDPKNGQQEQPKNP